MYKQIQLRKGKDESLRRFHPWVFSGAIQRMDEDIEEGEIVRVVTNTGDFIAVGHYQQGSIAVRVLSFSDVQIDDEFWHSRLLSALTMRQTIGIADNADNNTYRLVHGEGDNLPGLIIDVYGQTAVMQAHSIGMHLCRKQIARALVDVMDSRISHIYYTTYAGKMQAVCFQNINDFAAKAYGFNVSPIYIYYNCIIFNIILCCLQRFFT